MPTSLTGYLAQVCGIDTSALPESGPIRVTLHNRCDLTIAPVVINPEDQLEAATISLNAAYTEIKNQSSARAQRKRIAGQDAVIGLSLLNPFDKRFAALFMSGVAGAAGTAPTPDPVPWDGEASDRVDFYSNAGKLPTPYSALIEFQIGASGTYAPLKLWAPMAFPTAEQIQLQRAVDQQSGAQVQLECMPDRDLNGLFLRAIY